MAVALSVRSNETRLIPGYRYDRKPTFYIFGGLVFSPLTRNLIARWGSRAPATLRELEHQSRTEDRRQIVVLLSVLPAKCNTGYHDKVAEVITTVNGQPVRDFKQFVSLIEGGKGRFIELTNSRHREIVLNRAEAKQEQPEILKRFRIEQDRSDDLLSRGE